MKLALVIPLSFSVPIFAVPFHALPLLGLERRGNQFYPPNTPIPIPRIQPGDRQSSSLIDHPWIPASHIRDASRSPCPLLNTIANHGFLPRDGRNVTSSKFEAGLIDAINLDPTLAGLLTDNAATSLGQDPENFVVDLENLNAHNKTEHDQSMTRLDKKQGNTLHVQEFMIRQLLDDTEPKSYPWLNTSSMGETRLRRYRESRSIGSPPLLPKHEVACFAESALVVVLLEDGIESKLEERKVLKGSAFEWLWLEKFPHGWMRSTSPITKDIMDSFAANIKAFANNFAGTRLFA